MIKVAWVIGKLVAGIFLSIFYIKLLFHHHVFIFSLFGTDNRNLNYYFPALVSGPLLVFLLSSRKWSVAGFIVLLLMVVLPSIDVHQQAAIKAEEEREYQEHLRRQMAAEQSALPVIAKAYPGKITNQEFDGGPWGDCTSILARVEGSRGTILYDYDIVQDRIVGSLTEDLFKPAVLKYLPDASEIHVTKTSFGLIEFTFKHKGKEREATAFLEYGCQPLSLVSILYETDEDYNEIPTPYSFLDTP